MPVLMSNNDPDRDDVDIERELKRRANYRTIYWKVVRRTVREVFRVNPDAVDPVKNGVNGSSEATQDAFYQTDPFSVAADISGRTEDAGTPEEQRQYLDIRRELRFGPVEIPGLYQIAAEASTLRPVRS